MGSGTKDGGDCTPYFAHRVPARFSGLIAASAVICHALWPAAATFCHSWALSVDVFCHLGHKVRPPLPPRLVARPHDGGAMAGRFKPSLAARSRLPRCRGLCAPRARSRCHRARAWRRPRLLRPLLTSRSVLQRRHLASPLLRRAGMRPVLHCATARITPPDP